MQIALNKKYHIAITYDSESSELKLISNGKLIYNDKNSFKFKCEQKVQIGYNSFSNSKVNLITLVFRRSNLQVLG